MRKEYFAFSLTICIALLTGCGKVAGPVENAATEESISVTQVEGNDSEMELADSEKELDKAENTENDEKNEITTDSTNPLGPESGLYDRTYLEESSGGYTYRLIDAEIIEKYDALYLDAFIDIVDSYKKVTELQNQSFNSSDEVTVTNLVLKETKDTNVIKVGSYFEMDYNFDLNNIGYTYVDLDSDGTFELIFGVLKDADKDWIPKDYFERAYVLANGRPVKICEGGSRDLHWLGADGCIYETASGGAAYWGYSRLHFDITEVMVDEKLDWGNNGFVEDEFLGYLGSPVHIDGSSAGIEDASQVPEFQISEEVCEELMKEWESRQVEIEWLRMSDYTKKNSLLGT